MYVEIREATECDVDAIVRLREHIAAEGRWIAEASPANRLDGRRLYVDRIQRRDSCVYVTEHAELIDGVIAVELVHGVATVGMFVDAASRGQGKGAALLNATIDWARSHGAHKMALEVWSHNVPAIRLYRRAGFLVEGRRIRHYRRRNGELWDVVLMGLVLDEVSPGSKIDETDVPDSHSY